MEFSKLLNNYISQTGCSAKALSVSSGISASTISRYRNSKNISLSPEQIKKLSKGLCELSGGELDFDTVYFALLDSAELKDFDKDKIIHNLNLLIEELNINVAELAKSLNFDSSYLSRIKRGQRMPSDIYGFIRGVSRFTVKKHNSPEQISIIRELTGSDNENLEIAIEGWLCSNAVNKEDSISSFLNKLDDFNLDEYIEAIHFNDIKVPTLPFSYQSSRAYYGIENMRKAELDFFKATILSKSKQPIFMHSEMPLEDMAENVEFGKKWMMSVALALKKGLKINIIHNLDRPFNELLLGLEAWIPIYMTGQVAPYYIKNNNKGIFRHINYVSGSAALSGECIEGNHSSGKYYLTKIKNEVSYYQENADIILSKSQPLMQIFSEDMQEEFECFLNKELLACNDKCYIQESAQRAFKNISIKIMSGKWVIVSKSKSPKINFVIHHPKLVNAIENFSAPIEE